MGAAECVRETTISRKRASGRSPGAPEQSEPPPLAANGAARLPRDFDAAVGVREVCRRSGVPVGVADPVAPAKLCLLTKPEAD